MNACRIPLRSLAFVLMAGAGQAWGAEGRTFANGFETGGTATVDDPATSAGWYTSIAIGHDGLPVISYHDSAAGVLKVAHCRDASCAGATVTVLDGGVTRAGAFNSIAIGADGLPVVSYWDQTAFALKLARCARPDCTGGHSVSLVDGGQPDARAGLHTSVAIGRDGLPVIAYTDDSAFAVKVAHCNDPACAGGDETISVIDDRSVEFIGLYTAIAIGADGLPLISYYFSDGALKVAKCNDPACSGGDETVSMVDGTGNWVGWDSSIAIGADGLPVISYYDITAGALKVAKCNDEACAGGDEFITTVDDPAGLAGAYSSIAIGADGLPVISHHDATAGVLKVTHCGDAACSDNNATVSFEAGANRVGRFGSIAIGAGSIPVIAHQDATAGALKLTQCPDPACGAR